MELYKKMQQEDKLNKCKQAEQELNKMIEESLQYLVDNFNYKG